MNLLLSRIKLGERVIRQFKVSKDKDFYIQ